MNIIADVVLCSIILLCIVLGFYKGIVKSFVEFVGYFISIIAAVFLGNALSVFVYNSVLRGIMIKKISTAITTSAALPVEQKVQAVLHAFPNFVTNAMSYRGVTTQSLGKTLSASAATAAPKVADMLSPVMISLMKVGFTVLIFILLLMVVRLIANMLNTICSLPLLHQLNSLLGGVFGLLKGVVIVLLLCALVQLAVPMMKVESLQVVQKAINSSYVFKTIYQNNPIYSLLDKG